MGSVLFLLLSLYRSRPRCRNIEQLSRRHTAFTFLLCTLAASFTMTTTSPVGPGLSSELREPPCALGLGWMCHLGSNNATQLLPHVSLAWPVYCWKPPMYSDYINLHAICRAPGMMTRVGPLEPRGGTPALIKHPGDFNVWPRLWPETRRNAGWSSLV